MAKGVTTEGDSALWVKGEYFDSLDAVEAVARGTLGRDAQPCPFDRLEWFKRIWLYCPPGERPFIIRARTEGADAWLFLSRKGDGRLVPLASWYTLRYAPIFTGAPDEGLKRRLLRAIAKRLRAKAMRIAQIELHPLPPEDAQALRRAFRHAGWIAVERAATANWSLDVRGRTFEEYWDERPGNLRSTYERKRAKAPLDIEVADRFDQHLWDEYCTVYEASWKPAEGAPLCLEEFARSEGEAGSLRIGIAREGDRPVAAQLWTVENGVAIIHKLAYDKDYKELSPGTQLSVAMFRYAINVDGAQTIDYGTGDEPFKADWMENRRMLRRLDLFNPRRPGTWLAALRAELSALVDRRALD